MVSTRHTVLTQRFSSRNLIHEKCLLFFNICRETLLFRLCNRTFDGLLLLSSLRFRLFPSCSCLSSRFPLERFSKVWICPPFVVEVDCVSYYTSCQHCADCTDQLSLILQTHVGASGKFYIVAKFAVSFQDLNERETYPAAQ